MFMLLQVLLVIGAPAAGLAQFRDRGDGPWHA